ncbi:uncharacterized protein LOC121759971 isoform X2 [Salvia splendens]|uniref:uncharacterized protein LOC121759971 isoform X2 n=1 Tax=Salvia splendens TaxID=180675 RepID=UPI001C27A716|nr:uncharacterized protein LOC121759971 isoform X2 [Salvia splendens]
MRGRFRREGEGSCRSLQRSISWHMHPTVTAAESNSFFKERQEEVDQLLDKTRTEMHGTLQPGGRSPKQANGLTSASQLKPSSENAQNSGTSFPSQTKVKKRERGDHSVDPVKRERFSKTDDSASGQHKIEKKSDIAKITEKGGVVDFEGVEKLLQLMQHRVEKKMDLNSRAMLAGVVAATEKIECLNRFVQLKGLSVFDEWLQEIHKGKVGGGNNSKDGDKPVEEFLLVLLRALDNLPVNLPALQTCNIGRSVNHLRSHKNVEIQRKARSLVDTWKKRVQAEMTSTDAETGSAQGGPVWSSKSRPPEASHAASRTLSGSDVAMRSSITHSASKTTSVKSSHGENNTKSASSSPGPAKPSSPPASVKESQPGTSVGGSGTPDAPLIREDRSSSSNQSHSYSPSVSTKEEAKSSTAVSASKISSSSSRNRKGGGFPGVSGVQKDSSSSRSLSSIRNSTSDKVSQSGMVSERFSDGPVLEAGNPKLIVKIPNRSQSPSQGVRGVSPEDPSALSSQTSQPVISDKLDQFDNNSRAKSDALQCNASPDTNVESCRVNDKEDVVTGSGDGAGSAAVHIKEEKSISTEDSGRPMEGPKKNQLKCGKLHETSFSPMNALIESCVKYSEAHSSLSPEDDVGMNLLASVATGEMSRSEIVSPSDSTERSTPAAEGVCFNDDAKSKPSPEDEIRGTESQQVCNDGDGVYKKQVLLNGSFSEDGLHLSKQASFSTDVDCHPSHTSADMRAGEGSKPYDAASRDSRSTADPNWEFSKNLTEKTDANQKTGDEVDKKFQEENTPSGNGMDNIGDCKKDGTSVAGTDYKSGDDPSDTAKGIAMAEDAFTNQLCNMDCKSDVKDALMVGTNSMKKITAIVVKSELKERVSDEKTHHTSSHLIFSEAGDAVKVSEMDEKDIKTCVSDVERAIINRRVDRNTAIDGCSTASSCSTGDGLRSHNMETATEKKEISEPVSLPETGFPASVSLEGHTNENIRGSKPLAIKVDEVESASEVPSAAARADPDARVKFDLNEGFSVDDGKYGEPGSLAASFSTTVQMSNSLQASVNHFPTLHPASITVAAAAKGPFVPPEDLLRSKGELGWKGSAATSAFRPAEPRKVIEVPLATTKFSRDASTSKSGRAMLDIDLNVDLNEPDESFETASRDCYLVNDSSILLNKSSGFIPVLGSGGLDLDLNRVDESNENGQCSTSRSYNEESSVVLVKPSGGLPYADVQRGFDLNDQPGFDDGGAEHLRNTQQFKVALTSQLPYIGPRANNPGLGSLSSWFPPASTYSAAAIPLNILDRTDQSFQAIPPGASQRMFGHAGISPFTPDVYRGSVLSSSPAVSFPSGPFQFPVLPYGHSFPLSSANFPIGGTSFADASSGTRLFAPPVNSQLLGPVSAIPSQFQRPIMVGLPDNSSNSGLENSRKWVRQGLDLNAGPGAVEGDVREDNLPHSSSLHSVINSHAQAEEQARLCPVSGVKRAEPDGGWDKETIRYKQPSWQ